MAQPLCKPWGISSQPNFCSFLEYVCSFYVSFKTAGKYESGPFIDGIFNGLRHRVWLMRVPAFW